MSRSYRKTPMCGITTCKSDSKYKKYEHKRLRCAIRSECRYVHDREFGNPYWSPKDGKQSFFRCQHKDWYPKAMRK